MLARVLRSFIDVYNGENRSTITWRAECRVASRSLRKRDMAAEDMSWPCENPTMSDAPPSLPSQCFSIFLLLIFVRGKTRALFPLVIACRPRFCGYLVVLKFSRYSPRVGFNRSTFVSRAPENGQQPDVKFYS